MNLKSHGTVLKTGILQSVLIVFWLSHCAVYVLYSVLSVGDKALSQWLVWFYFITFQYPVIRISPQ
jgi:hypothetical protein